MKSNEWQDIETAPNNKQILVWLDGLEEHSGVMWKRSGYSLMVLRDGVADNSWLKKAAARIIGEDVVEEHYWNLTPILWMPLPEPPAGN